MTKNLYMNGNMHLFTLSKVDFQNQVRKLAINGPQKDVHISILGSYRNMESIDISILNSYHDMECLAPFMSPLQIDYSIHQ